MDGEEWAEPAPAAGPRRYAGTVVLAAALTICFVLAVLAGSRPPGSGSTHPAIPADVATAPLAHPLPAPVGDGGYRFLETEDDGSARPVRWDPCRPIHYVVRDRGEVPGGARAISAAVALVARITGLRFVFDGDTGEKPTPDRPTMDVGRYGDRWSPVLVAWTDPKEYPPMTGYAGLGGPDAVAGAKPGEQRYVTGVVLLNRGNLATVESWPEGRAELNAVVLHEFGHLIGLDHVPDPGELMYKQPSPHPGGFAAGDRRGLAALSDGPCFRDY